MSCKPFFSDVDQIGCYSRPVARPIAFVGCPNHSRQFISVCIAPFQPGNECSGIADRKNPAVFVFPNDVGGRAVRSGQDSQTGCLCLGQHNGVTILNCRQDKHVLLAVNGRKRELSLAWYEFNVTLGFRPQFSSFHREFANKTEIHTALEAPRNFEEVKSALTEAEGTYRQDSEWLARQYARAFGFDERLIRPAQLPADNRFLSPDLSLATPLAATTLGFVPTDHAVALSQIAQRGDQDRRAEPAVLRFPRPNAQSHRQGATTTPVSCFS